MYDGPFAKSGRFDGIRVTKHVSLCINRRLRTARLQSPGLQQNHACSAQLTVGVDTRHQRPVFRSVKAGIDKRARYTTNNDGSEKPRTRRIIGKERKRR